MVTELQCNLIRVKKTNMSLVSFLLLNVAETILFPPVL